jgi:hypothetical protein
MNRRDLGVFFLSAGLGSCLFFASGCNGDGDGDVCGCGSGNLETVENGEYQVVGSDPRTPEVQGASVSVSDDAVTITYEVDGEKVNVEYLVTATRKDLG